MAPMTRDCLEALHWIFFCGLFFKDEAEKAGEATLTTGENGNDSGISDAGETAEPAKDVFDLTLDKMDGL